MTTPPNSATGRAPKIMSSRLLTMKFMQRAASISSPINPSTSEEAHPTKRQRTSLPTTAANNNNDDNGSLPATPLSELETIRAALEEEERKQSEAMERLGEERGETRWVFNYVDSGDGKAEVGMRVKDVGWGDIDGEGEGEEGRRSWGRFNKELEKRQRDTEDRPETSMSSSSQEEGSSQDSDESDGEKVERKVRRKEKKAEAARQAERRKSKVVKLNKLSAISGGGGGSGSKNMECFRCGEMGHRKSECEKSGSGKRGARDKGRDLGNERQGN